MKPKSTEKFPLWQIILDNYMYYVVINKNHRQQARRQLKIKGNIERSAGQFYHA